MPCPPDGVRNEVVSLKAVSWTMLGRSLRIDRDKEQGQEKAIRRRCNLTLGSVMLRFAKKLEKMKNFLNISL